MRTIIDLPEDQLEGLAAVCEREKASRAEVIRRAVALYLASRPPARETGTPSVSGGRGTSTRSPTRIGPPGVERLLKAVLDTNILVDYLRGIEPARDEIDLTRRRR